MLAGGALALLQAGATIGFAWALATLVTRFIDGAEQGSFGGNIALLLVPASDPAL